LLENQEIKITRNFDLYCIILNRIKFNFQNQKKRSKNWNFFFKKESNFPILDRDIKKDSNAAVKYKILLTLKIAIIWKMAKTTCFRKFHQSRKY